MAAFCTCCGAAITTKSEKCLVCGAPRHGMKSTVTPSEQTKDESAGTKKSIHELSIA
jgi:hypothetical protein